MKLELTVCNVCKAHDRDTSSYRITREGKAVTVDLCHEHARPIEDVIASALVPMPPSSGKRGTTATGGRRSARATPILTMDEVEARKKGKK